DVRRPDELFARLGRDANIGFGEAYLTGAWDAPDLAGFLTVLAARLEHLVPKPLHAARAFVLPRIGRHDHGREEDTRRNIAHHYDLSNDLFATFLDPTMTYSSAWFEEGDDLERAQLRKIDALLDLAGVGAGTRVLEIGTGWGALAIRAASRGATVRSITLSEEQAELARARVAAAGLADSVEVELCDYRAVSGEYDAVVSVEMIEAVGWRYWSAYFSTIDRVLAPGGRVAIQAITMADHRMRATRDGATWITKYIFPGGFLPSVEALDRTTREDTTLRLTGSTALGPHYAETLRRWDEAFTAHADRVEELGFDGDFRRMWHYYLEYCRAGFAAGYINVHQLLFTRESA
ncbi:MAG TPA: cyclopropane-fatty-acyl-phospholipid synthase family protein, partial [Nocardioides sp.]|nr:cyclopropane-fatty-acyl-phospholipid synthase family protein [Nocardioides sp.]